MRATDPLIAVTGSVTRAYSLSILAGTRVPQTAYRIAKLAGLSAPNVYVELKRLEKADILRKDQSGWYLRDEKVRQFFEGTGPLYRRAFSLSLRSKRRQGMTAPLLIEGKERSAAARRGSVPRLLRQFSDSVTKNALLRAAGLRESRHKQR